MDFRHADETPSGDDLAPNGRPPAAWSSHGSPSAEEDSHDQLRSGQSYDRITASGSSRLHAGNVYNSYYQVEPSAPRFATTHEESDTLEIFLRCLSFEQMETRLASIATAHPDTCAWVVDCPPYKRWRDHNLQAEHHGYLWIKGKPGAGKSTIMKNLLRHIEAAEVGDKVVSFFFNARGAILERTTEGLYRSLLYQMAGDVPSPLTDLRAETMKLYSIRGWPLELLKDLCRKAFRHLASETKITIFVDALDEGNVKDDVRDMVTFIEELAAETYLSRRTLRICLASRHYPAISILHSELLILDTLEGHDDDITTYVRAQLRIDSPALRAKLVASIVERARAVFLWVVLVVKILNKETDRGNQHLLEAKLEELPNGLYDLFDAILMRDTEHDPRLLPALLWVLFGEESLEPIELYYAVMVSTGQLGADNFVWNPAAVDHKVLASFLLSSSMGLLETVASLSGRIVKDKVQIIHESVREYLLLHGLQKLDEDLSLNARTKCHGRLATWCSIYVEMAVTYGLLGRTEQSRAMRQCPLLNYVVWHALEHAERAAQGGYQHSTHTGTSFETWRLVDDIRVSRPEFYVPTSTIHPNDFAALQTFSEEGIGREPLCTTMLHLLILQRLPYLVDIELEQNAKRDATERRLFLDAVCLRADGYGSEYSKSGCSALEMAVAMRDVGITRALLREGADANVSCERHGSPLKVALRRVQNKIDDKIEGDNAFDYDEYDGLPIFVRDELEITRLLLQNGAASPIDRPLEIASPLHRAIETKDWAIVKSQMRVHALWDDFCMTPDGLDQPLDRETVARSDDIAEMVDLLSLWATDPSLSDSRPEIFAPPHEHITKLTVHSRIYRKLWGHSIRRNLPC